VTRSFPAPLIGREGSRRSGPGSTRRRRTSRMVFRSSPRPSHLPPCSPNPPRSSQAGTPVPRCATRASTAVSNDASRGVCVKVRVRQGARYGCRPLTRTARSRRPCLHGGSTPMAPPAGKACTRESVLPNAHGRQPQAPPQHPPPEDPVEPERPAERPDARPPTEIVDRSFTVSSCPCGQVQGADDSVIGRVSSNVSPQARHRYS
jgi:hypothetical protein